MATKFRRAAKRRDGPSGTASHEVAERIGSCQSATFVVDARWKHTGKTMLWTRIPPKVAALAMWLMATAFIGFVGGFHIVPQLISLHDLAAFNRVTQGEIVETYPQTHSTCRYRYLVDHRFYEQTGRSCGSDRIGQQVTVHFSPDDPSNSLNANPAATFVNDVSSFVAALILLPTFLATITYIRARRAFVVKA
jgi:hypothetical protein